MTIHEQSFVGFLAEPSRTRIGKLFAAGPKHRHKLCALLDHSVRLEPRFANALQGQDGRVEALTQRLKDLQAPGTCFAISSHKAWDGVEMSTDEALKAVVGAGFGTFLSFIPDKLGYFEFESPKSQFLLRK